ncbi:MAG: NAD-dependent epimerase/dehydratase family protein [Candidatus Omnitrophica bacterium]|nr:NAD-dependent epimerase/dehydratase family protein [Candidatus Omnitrophota bacterium]
MFYKGKKVLVTGGAGFVGTHIVEELLKHDAKVRVSIHNRPMIVKDKNVETVQADLANLGDCIQAVKGVDYIFHAAGAVAAAAVTTTNPMEAIIGNLVLTARILQASWECKVGRVLIFSSSTGYPAADYPIKEEEMWKAHPHPTYFGYGWMRRYLELLGEYVHSKSGVKVVIVRPTAVYGRHDNFNPKTSHVIPALIRRAVEKENPFVVWGTGDEVRDFLHIKDLARACLLMLEKCPDCDPVNIGYGKVVTVKEIVNAILEAAGHNDRKIVFDSSKPTTIPFRMVDTTKAKRLLGFEPSISLEEGLRDTVEWYVRERSKA